MIEYRTGNILEADAEALVNSVNCVGVMGRGIALQFKKAFPANFKAYKAACERHEVQPGRMFVFETHELTNPHYIINFPTKRHWRGASRLEDIQTGLEALVSEIGRRGIHSVAIPALGSGLGGLEWSEVKATIEHELADLPEVRILVFEPAGDLAQVAAKNRKVPTMTAGRAALVGLMDRYLAGLMDPFVTLLELHKLMYFMQEAGEPLRLRYVKGVYGPYAENLRHVLVAMEGHLVSGFRDGGERPDKAIALVPGAIEDATRFLESQPETQNRLERVTDLVQGFETPFGLELLATVHWLTEHEAIEDADGIIDGTYAWSDRKKQFSERQLRLALDHLEEERWLSTTAV